MGRLSINPLKHLSLIGTLMPIILYISNMPMFGFAKPVPYNPEYFKKPKRDMILVGIAGPIANFLLSIITLFIFVKLHAYSVPDLNDILEAVININLVLCFFNLIPIPPLDGSILYMSSILHKNHDIAQKLTLCGYGLLIYIMIFSSLTTNDIIRTYLQYCINAVLWVFR